MNPIESISQVLSDHARKAINDTEALNRVWKIACEVDPLMRLLVSNARTEVEHYTEQVRIHVESVAVDAQRIVADMKAGGPSAVMTTWIDMHVKGLVEAKAKLAEARTTLQKMEGLTGA